MPLTEADLLELHTIIGELISVTRSVTNGERVSTGRATRAEQALIQWGDSRRGMRRSSPPRKAIRARHIRLRKKGAV